MILQTYERILDAPYILDDFYLNLLDWSSRNVVGIAIENSVYLWNASDTSSSELVTVDDQHGPVTSINWAQDGCHLAVGLNNSLVQIWDTTAKKQVNIIQKYRPCCYGAVCVVYIYQKVFMYMGNNIGEQYK